MSAEDHPQATSGRGRVGRRPRLTMNQLLDAALEMGLEQLTIAGLAAKLGTGMAAVYRLVESRDDLVLKAAAHAANIIPPVVDAGQGWREYLFAYAEQVLRVLSRDQSYLVRFLEGGLGPEVQMDQMEAALQALVARGFEPHDALRIVRSVTLLVLGAATATVHLAGACATRIGQAEAARSAIAKRPREQVPVLAGLAEAYGDEALMADWRTPLRWLLDSAAHEFQARAASAAEKRPVKGVTDV
jgi:AcrR family transcriptional regulator